MSNQRYIVLDTETTGFKPEEGHRIVEIGAVELHGFQKGDTYQQYINPERDVPEASFQVHGLSRNFLKDKKLFVQVVDDFLKFIGDSTLLIHNSDFDMNFINHHLAELGFPHLGNEVIDTVKVARKKFPGQSNSLDALCRRFDISLDDRKSHGALKDSLLLADVWLELNGGRQASLNLAANPSSASSSPSASSVASSPASSPPSASSVASSPASSLASASSVASSPASSSSSASSVASSPASSSSSSQIHAARPFAAKDEELSQHQQLLQEKIPNNLWGNR